jgi:hypothetical protein
MKSLVVAVACGLLVLLQLWRFRGPEVVPASASADRFSAARAMESLRATIVDEPHPVGSAAHDAVRDRVLARFRDLGYETRVQKRFACNAHNVCATIENILATPSAQGSTGPESVIVAAHYDSVPAGPGMSDDGTGVATLLEIARAVRHERFANRITFLIDDGEETGLLGAEAFAADPELARTAGFVINLEARGTTGPAFLFETSRNNRWMLPDLARALPRPIGSSFFVTIYDLLPNDTDLTVFKRDGKPGVNFAYLGHVAHYHTPLDNLAHTDATVVQQRGDQVLALLRQFANSDLRRVSRGDAVWFDVMTFFIVWWPAAVTLWIALLGLGLTIAAAVLRMRRGALTARAITTGVLAFFAAILGSAAAGFALSWIIGLRARAMWVAHPAASIAAMWLAGIAVAIVIAAAFLRRGGHDGLALGHALVWNVIAVALAVLLPGASYFAVVPGLVLAIAALVRALAGPLRDGGELATALAGAIAAFVVMGPVALVSYDALGRPSLTILAVLLALMTTTASPLLARGGRMLAVVAGGLAIVLTIVALLSPPYTRESPRRLSLMHQTEAGQTGQRQTLWIAESLTPSLRAAAAFEAKTRDFYPWYGGWPQSVAPAPPIAIAPVEAHVVSDVRGPKRTLTIDVVSPRNASRVSLAWKTAATVDSIRINGVAPPPRPLRFRDAMAPQWHQVVVRGSSARIEIVMREAAPIEAVAADGSSGLPPAGAALMRARDASPAIASQEGDQTTTRRTYRW